VNKCREMEKRISIAFGSHTVCVDVTPAEDGAMLFDDGELTGGEPFDSTGLVRVWPASIVLCRWLTQQTINGARVLELGAGTGMPSLLCAQLGAARVIALDCNDEVVDRLQRNMDAAGHQQACARQLSWEQQAELLGLAAAERIDSVVLADVAYPLKDCDSLLVALRALLLAQHPLTMYV
jgi:predicted nicotinamide N-methyase